MFSFGLFPGFLILYSDISEHSVCSIFITYNDRTECPETSAFRHRGITQKKTQLMELLRIISLAYDQLDAQILIDLLYSSTCTCFEQYLAHPQEVKLS
jgi:hypothetical protein